MACELVGTAPPAEPLSRETLLHFAIRQEPRPDWNRCPFGVFRQSLADAQAKVGPSIHPDPSLTSFEVAPFTVMVAESSAIERVSVGLVPTGPATGRLPNPVLKTAALRPAGPDGSNAWRAKPNSRGFRPGQPDGERLNNEVSLVADPLLIPPEPARRKSAPISATSKLAQLQNAQAKGLLRHPFACVSGFDSELHH